VEVFVRYCTLSISATDIVLQFTCMIFFGEGIWLRGPKTTETCNQDQSKEADAKISTISSLLSSSFIQRPLSERNHLSTLLVWID
jgi:hypothetical protein